MRKIFLIALMICGVAAAQTTDWTPQKTSVSTFGKYGVWKAGDSAVAGVKILDTADVSVKGTVSVQGSVTARTSVLDTAKVTVTNTVTTQDILYNAAHSFFQLDTLIMSSNGADTSGVSGHASDTLVHYFGGKWFYGFVCIDDSTKSPTTGTATTDSVFVERYDTATATWRSAMVGLRDMYTNVVGTNPAIPGNGLQKMYLLNEPYPMTYRVRYASTTFNTSGFARRTIIRWVWKAL